MISASVGQNGANVPGDVREIQTLLNQCSNAGLAVDGQCGPATIAAIKAFQAGVAGVAVPDGLISPSGPTWQALIAAVPVTTDAVIDVSHYQGQSIAWARVFAAGKTVAMIKACEGLSTDDTYHINAPAARQAGLAVIPYMFLTNDAPAAQARYFQNVTGLAAGQPYALDWEGNGAPPAQLVEAVGTALTTITHRAPLGYWGASPPNTPTAAMQTWPRWIPRYGLNTGTPDFTRQPGAPWLFWQYTSAGTVDGITGNVDASLFAGTAAQLAQWCADGTMPA